MVASSAATKKEMQSFHSRDYMHFLETHSNQSDSGDEEEGEDMDMYGLGEIPAAFFPSQPSPSPLSLFPPLPSHPPPLTLFILPPPFLHLLLYAGYDCPLFPGLYDYVCEVGGASLTSADLLLSGEASTVINWYGGWHHAKR